MLIITIDKLKLNTYRNVAKLALTGYIIYIVLYDLVCKLTKRENI